jgi:hypothetical protein
MPDYEEELQHLTADEDAPSRRRSSDHSLFSKFCGGAIMLLPLPRESELRVTISPSTSSRRRKYIVAAATGCPLTFLLHTVYMRSHPAPFHCSDGLSFCLELLEPLAAAP